MSDVITYTKFGPRSDIRGWHVTLAYTNGRVLIGEVVDYFYVEGPPSGWRLDVRHFNGEPWPIQPSAGSVRVLPRSEPCDIRPDAFGRGGCDKPRAEGSRFCATHLAAVQRAGAAGK